MKKILFLCSALLCCFSVFSQTLSAPSVMQTGTTITVNFTGESNAKYVSYISLDPTATTSSTYPSSGGNYVNSSGIDQYHYYTLYSVPQDKTSFTFHASSVIGTPNTVTFYFNVGYMLNSGASVQNNQRISFTITINPVPVIQTYTSTKSGVFIKNSCGAGFAGSAVTYSHTSTSQTSQAAADAAAQADVNANGQAYANANGICRPAIYVRTQLTNLVKHREEHYPEHTGHDLVETDGYTEKTYGDLSINIYSDAACTIPLSLPTSLTVKIHLYNTNGDSIDRLFDVPANTSAYNLGTSLMKDYSNIEAIESSNDYWWDVIDNSNTYISLPSTRP